MSLSRFGNSSFIHAAHYQAYDKLSLLHRDVSGGNVLIYPRISKMQDGRYRIVFTGLLADWEMAKSIDVTDPRQPERTVSLTTFAD